MGRARPGHRVADRYGNTGTILSVLGHTVNIEWDDGYKTQEIASTVYRIDSPRWVPIAAFLCVAVAVVLVAISWLS